jgi:hypothetical protein
VFIDDADFSKLWAQSERYYVAVKDNDFEHVSKLVPSDQLHLVAEAGGKALYTNQEITANAATQPR